MLFTLLFSLLLISSCLVVAQYGKQWNLKAFLALGSGALLSLCFLDFLPHSFNLHGHSLNSNKHSLDAPIHTNSHSLDSNSSVLESFFSAFDWSYFFSTDFIAVFILAGILLQALADIYLLPRLSFLDRFLQTQSSIQHQHAHTFNSFSVCSVAGCLSICSFFDGIRLYSAVSIEDFVAFSTAFGLFFHLLSEGVLIASLALSSGFKKQILLVLIGILGGTLFIGALVAKLFSQNFSLNGLLAFSTGCLIYICFVHLMPISLKSSSRHWFFIGLVTFAILHFIF